MGFVAATMIINHFEQSVGVYGLIRFDPIGVCNQHRPDQITENQ